MWPYLFLRKCYLGIHGFKFWLGLQPIPPIQPPILHAHTYIPVEAAAVPPPHWRSAAEPEGRQAQVLVGQGVADTAPAEPEGRQAQVLVGVADTAPGPGGRQSCLKAVGRPCCALLLLLNERLEGREDAG